MNKLVIPVWKRVISAMDGKLKSIHGAWIPAIHAAAGPHILERKAVGRAMRALGAKGKGAHSTPYVLSRLKLKAHAGMTIFENSNHVI